MSILAVYGASGLGREILELAQIINSRQKKWDRFIFVDDGDVPEIVNEHRVYKYEEAKNEFGGSLEFAVGIGEPVTREKIFNKIRDDRYATPTLLHPDIYVPQSTHIGNGVIIQYGVFVSCNVTIADYVFVQPQCNIGHDDILEEGCMIAGFGNLGGIVHIGKWSYVGLSTAIKQNVNIGDFSIVGMGSIVHKDIPSNVTAMGNPARVIAKNEDRKVFGH